MDSLFTQVCLPGGVCDLIGVWLAALLTILVWTYLLRDTVLFRLASALLVGTAAGLVSAVVIRTVIWDQLLAPLVADAPNLFLNQLALLVVLIFLCLPMLLKLTPNFRSTTFSNLGLAYLIGIGAALAIGGALRGILVPQLRAVMNPLPLDRGALDLLSNLILLVGTLGAFLAFRFVQPGNRPWQRTYELVARSWGTVGRGFIMIAFGATLAGLITARVSVLVAQLYFLFHDWLHLI